MIGALSCSAPAFALASADQQLDQLMGRLWTEQLHRFPELANRPAAGLALTELGGRLSDWSRSSRADWAGWARSAIRRIEAIDATALPQATELNRAILLDHFGKVASLSERYPFGAAAADADAPVAPYAISPATGPHRAVTSLLMIGHPIAGRTDAEAWLQRLGQFARALDGATDALRADAAVGVTPPAFALEAVRSQLATLRGPQPDAHPLAERFAALTAAAGLPGAWRDKAITLIAERLYPALDRQIAALAAASPPTAAGAWTLPQGAQYYADALAWHTGTQHTAAEAHQLGREQVARLSAEMGPLLDALGLPAGSLGERLQALGQRPEERFAADAGGRSAILDAFAAAVERVRPRLPDLFAVPTPDRLAVAPLPEAIARQRADACLLGGELAGTRADTLYVNLQDLSAWPRYCIASTAFHGSVPARVWPGGASRAADELPAIRRCGMQFAACTEGWSLYAEQVADEQGLYAHDPASRLGYLRTRLVHAARLVADTGLNDRRWTIAQTAAYLTATAGLDASSARGEAETMALLPGKACAHAVGQAEWERLRDLARRVAGPGFDQRRFHQLAQFGGAPFAVIEDLVTTTFTRRRSVLTTRMV